VKEKRMAKRYQLVIEVEEAENVDSEGDVIQAVLDVLQESCIDPSSDCFTHPTLIRVNRVLRTPHTTFIVPVEDGDKLCSALALEHDGNPPTLGDGLDLDVCPGKGYSPTGRLQLSSPAWQDFPPRPRETTDMSPKREEARLTAWLEEQYNNVRCCPNCSAPLEERGSEKVCPNCSYTLAKG
jgi:hypothetical protein